MPKGVKKDDQHTNIGGTAVPNDMIAQPKEETALAINDEKMIAEIRQLSNSADTANVTFPILKLQHTTTPDGEPNPLRGHFTIVRKNDLGEYEIEDLGETIKFQFLLRRYFLKMQKGDDVYSSSDFDDPMDKVPLWKRNGDQTEMFAEDTPHSLQARFLKKDDKERIRSELNILSKLYVMINSEVLVWKLSLTGTIQWSKYTKLVPFAAGVITAAAATKEKKGSVTYYQPAFKAEERLTDLTSVRDNIQLLKDMLPRKNQESFIVEEEDVPFK